MLVLLAERADTRNYTGERPQKATLYRKPTKLRRLCYCADAERFGER